MSTLSIVLLSSASLLLLLVLAYAGYLLHMLRAAARPIPIDTGATARPVATDLPLDPGDPTWTLDLFGPQDEASSGRPVLLFVPGDGPDWLMARAKGWGMFRSYAELCAARGWSAAVMGHRSSGSYRRCQGMVDDVRAALGILRRRAEELGVDPDRVVVWTFSGSAGPVLADLLERPDEGVRGMLSFYGFLDLSCWPLKLPADVVERWSLPRALGRLETLPCPLYLLAAGRDRKPMTRAFEATRRVLEGRNLPVTTRVHTSGQHGFEVLGDPRETEVEIHAALDFVARCLEA